VKDLETQSLKFWRFLSKIENKEEKICQFPMGNVVLFLAGLMVASARGCNVQIGLCSVAG
jgi:hypothetical protein